MSEHRSILRIVRYPQLDSQDTTIEERAGEHTDWGTVTILYAGTVSAL